MHLVSALAANVLALSVAVLPATTAAAPGRADEFCDWQPSPELGTVQNTIRRDDSGSKNDPELKKIIDTVFDANFKPKIEPVDDGRVINVSVHMHVVGEPKINETEFLVSRTSLQRQLDFLNQSYKPANISFTLSSVDWTKGDMGVRGFFLREPLAKSLHRGNFTELNIFFCDDDDTRGGSTTTGIVQGFRLSDDDDKADGCVVNANTVPGGSHPVWNQGVTVVHEVGHWFGLGHTTFTGQEECQPNWRNVTGLTNEPCGVRCDYNFMSYGAE
ncbi:Pregnancy-associated plasma protein-A [Metarhizium guizhouense ARSEF 977]|uniref:Pregnancy-associated plasma protein-A n=1 Tax=Metarhizium guizhouense (strain ARSEF 977) TaxID=1276136 RepID=A0A0B4H268_METGA|nr:Pregnancy-associated plasma protein-A [Metarhizium guizhouense ARSEF 977]